MRATLQRSKDTGNETIGRFSLFDNDNKLIFECDTLERAWKDNQHMISCIPTGVYLCVWHWMESAGRFHFEICNVPDRTGVFIHSGNLYEQTHGCLLLGSGFGDINADGEMDLLNSSNIIKSFEKLWQKQFELTILAIPNNDNT
jgi:hypothetical protein